MEKGEGNTPPPHGKRCLMFKEPHGCKQFNLEPNHDCSGTCTCAESPIYGILAPGELPTPPSESFIYNGAERYSMDAAKISNMWHFISGEIYQYDHLLSFILAARDL